MKKRALRWSLFVLALAFLLKSVFGRATLLSVGAFFLCGALWYYLTRRKTLELDARRPRKPFGGS
jgi:hypothetical protein